MNPISFDDLECGGCPAEHLLDDEEWERHLERIEHLRHQALERMGGEPRLLILCESAPKKRKTRLPSEQWVFVYDPDCDYGYTGLRPNLRRELVGGHNDKALFDFLDQRRIWIVDCALCPINTFEKNFKARRHAAAACLQRHTRRYLDEFPDIPIISIFPSNCGPLKLSVPWVYNRIRYKIPFSSSGLREAIDQLFPPPILGTVHIRA